MRVRALLTAAALLAVAACGGGPPDQAARVTLTWWDYLDHSPQADQAVASLISRYQADHPGVEIKRTALPRAGFDAKLAQATVAGTFPDVVAVDVVELPRMASQGLLADVTERFDAWELKPRFLPAVRESVLHGGRLYGVPLRTTTTALIYNEDHFAATGVGAAPRTWDQLRVTARALSGPGRSGLCFAGAGDDLTTSFLPFLWQAGGDVTEIDSAASVSALSFVDGLVNVDRSAPAEALGWTAADVEREFVAGRCAMMLHGPQVVPNLNQAGMAWASAPLPEGPAGAASPLGGEAWVIGHSTKHADAAWEVVKWLAENRDNATELGAALSALPNRTDTLEDLAWRWDPNVAGFARQMPQARARAVYGPKYAEISEAVSAMARQVLADGRGPAEASADARSRITPLLP